MTRRLSRVVKSDRHYRQGTGKTIPKSHTRKATYRIDYKTPELTTGHALQTRKGFKRKA